MTTMTETSTQLYQVWIKATPEAIWDAITQPEWTKKYGYPGHTEYELRAGGAFKALAGEEMVAMGAPAIIVDGEVVEADAPRKLVQTWRFLWDPELVAEGFTRVTWEIDADEAGICKLTVTHELEGAPLTAAQVAGEVPDAGGGWSYILSDLKTLLEIGTPLDS
jgi:uncharacterized protein YndB with AHSA1/START domain